MPELVIDFITSLDGYGAAEGWPGWWGLEGPEYLAWLADHPEADSTVLMGANTYRLMSGLASDGEPGTDALAGLSKVVFSSTLTEPLAWPEHPTGHPGPGRGGAGDEGPRRQVHAHPG
jgi:dihydrofolate reductase